MVERNLRHRSLVSGAILSAVLGLAAVPARADMSLYDADGLKIDGAITGGFAGFSSPGAQFGAGAFHNNGAGGTSPARSGHPAWTEWFLAPELKAAYETEAAGTFYGDVSAQVTATGGDGEPSLIQSTYGRPVLVEVENLYAGWKSGKTLDGLGVLDENGLDLSGGRQSFRVADGFLISNGVSNAGKRGMFWTQSRTAFAQTGLAKIAAGPVRADIFYLQNASANSLFDQGLIDNARTKVLGANVEWFENLPEEEGKPAKDGASNYADRKWYAGVTYFNVISAADSGNLSFNGAGNGGASTVTNTLSSNRNGMNVFSFHAGGNFISAIPDFSFYGNAVIERNDTANHKVDANAFYVEPGYQLSDLPLTPKLTYRYAHFSGDGNPDDTVKKAYDPFFYNAITRGYGTWFIGEIVGNYVISNSNVNIHEVALSVFPTDSLKLSVWAYKYTYDKAAQNAGVSSNELAREIDVTAEYTLNDNVSLSAALGLARAGRGYREFVNANGQAGFTTDRTWVLGESAIVVKF